MTKVAAIQMVSGHDLAANLEEAARLLAQAAGQGAKVAVLPENFAVLATAKMRGCGEQEAGPEPVIRRFLADQARQHKLWRGHDKGSSDSDGQWSRPCRQSGGGRALAGPGSRAGGEGGRATRELCRAGHREDAWVR